MNDYLEERVKKQREWYESKANENKKAFMSYQTVVIVLGALIPVVVVFENVFTILKGYGGIIAAIISAVISIAAGLDKLKQPQPNWFNYRANEEAIKKEEWFFKYKAGPYRKQNEEAAKILFIERIESIISADIARMITSKEDKSTDDDDDALAGLQSQNKGKCGSNPKGL